MTIEIKDQSEARCPICHRKLVELGTALGIALRQLERGEGPQPLTLAIVCKHCRTRWEVAVAA